MAEIGRSCHEASELSQPDRVPLLSLLKVRSRNLQSILLSILLIFVRCGKTISSSCGVDRKRCVLDQMGQGVEEQEDERTPQLGLPSHDNFSTGHSFYVKMSS